MSVSQFIAYLNDTFKAIWDPQMVAVEGEITGFRVSQGQWVNFDVKDEAGLVPVFMVLAKLHVPLQDGMRVRLYGYPRVYPKYGKFSFQADRAELVGEGGLQRALALLRKKLEDEGMFEVTRKRSLTRFPKHIALIASRESAAYGDFVRILHERWRGLEIDLYHVHVQGEQAPGEIVQAIKQANQYALELEQPYDALILTRGGGSLEELMSFNDERVVRALFASRVPTLVGIGHERDITFAEEVADVRGSTPTDCARRLVPDRADVLYEIASLQEGIGNALEGQIEQCTRQIGDTMTSVDRWVKTVMHRFELITSGLDVGLDHWLQDVQQRLAGLDRVLRSCDPRAVLRRGYALVRDAAGNVITSVDKLEAGELFALQLRDGSVDATVSAIKKPLF